MAEKLQLIERARKEAAEAGLVGARADLAEAKEASAGAIADLDQAECNWIGHLGSSASNLELGQALGRHLLECEALRTEREEEQRKAEARLAAEQQRWRAVEAKVRSGEIALRRGRRLLSKRAEDARSERLSEATTWKWFSR